MKKIAFGLAAMMMTSMVHAEELTIERLESGPSLSGGSVQGLKISPDGSIVTFLKGKADNPLQLDLWQYDTKTGKTALFIDSNDFFAGGKEQLSEEEKARRERNRALSGKSGIVTYSWGGDGASLIFPIGGDVFLKPLNGEIKQLTATPEYETDIKVSPKGTYVSFIRNRELFIVNVKTGVETQLTTGATDTIANGMAEFVAQEELGRFTGYWWSPDETRIAFERYDESGVLVKDRYEVQEDGSVITLKQRYPEAGTANVKWSLGVVKLDEGNATEWPEIPGDKTGKRDDYLARLNWSGDSRYFVFQQLSRDQSRLDYVFRSRDGANEKAAFEDTSDVWINLTNDFKFLKTGNILFTREGKDGFRHIYLMSSKGKIKKQLTSGDWVVSSIEKVDEDTGTVYFSGFMDTPLEQHLYKVSLKGGSIKRVTQEEGWHNVMLGDDFFIDNFSSPEQPPQIAVKSLKDGTVMSFILENKLDKTHPYAPYVETAAHKSFGSLKAQDGTELYYHLYLPPNYVKGQKYPTIMAPYGGPHGQSWGVSFNEILARNGFIVMVLDNRGMWNRGLKFEGHIKNAMGTVEVEDQVSGVNYLIENGYADPGNIGIWGWSYGGYMTIINLFKEPDVFKAGVSVAPVTDWRLYDTAYTERYLGLPDAPGNVYEKSSVFPYLDDFKGKLLLMHGMADDNVFFDHSVKLMSGLQNAGKPFDLMTYPGKKHGIRGYEARTHLWHKALEFFNRTLKTN